MRLNRAGIAGGIFHLALGLAWVFGAGPPGPAWLLVAWFVAVALVGSFIPGAANQISLTRAHLAAPALAYSLAPGRLGLIAVVVAIAGLSDLVDGTIARRLARPSSLGGALDPVVDGVFMGAVALGLAAGGAFPPWLALVVVTRYLVPVLAGGVLIALGRQPELRHTLTGQVSTTLILILLGGISLFRGLDQDSSGLVSAGEVVISISTAATFAHLAWASRRPVAAPEPG